VLAVGLVALYVLVPPGGVFQVGLHLTVHAGTVAAAAIAVHRHPRGRRMGPALLLSGLTLYLGANVVFYTTMLGLPVFSHYPPLADLAFLAGYALVVAGVALVHAPRRAGRAHANWGSLADAMIITGGVAVAAWEFLIDPNVSSTSATSFSRFVWVTYPMIDLFLVVITVQLVLRRKAWSGPLVLITSFVVFQLAGDADYGLRQASGSYHVGGISEVFWFVSLLCMLVACLHRDVGELSEPESVDDKAGPSWLRQLVMTASALVVPLSFVAVHHRIEARDQYVDGAIATIVITLAIGRIGGYGRRLARQARHDSLTDLPNRAFLLDWLDDALSRTGERHTQVAVLFVDLDGFKAVNDSLGHDVGDALLVAVAGRLSTVVRDRDIVARLGGDEFVIACEGPEGAVGVDAVANRLVRALAEPVVLGNREIFVRASIGVRISTGRQDSAFTLLRDADAAMYQAKSEGGGVALFDDRLRRENQAQLEIESDLHRALERDEFRVFYQPTVTLEGGELVGVEALLRWERPGRGLVLPGEFIGVAEQSGLIVPIGLWVFEQACRQLAVWRAQGTQRLTMAVNLSPRQLRSPDFVTTVSAILERTGADPSQVCLEVTESVLVDDANGNISTLAALHDLGLRIAIDDFGTGYSSLAYLRDLPVDVVKIDRTFVSKLGSEEEAAVIVTSVVRLAEALHLETVAEGVETVEQRSALQALGCQLAQGFYWSKPVPARELAGWLVPGSLAASLARVS